MAEFVKLVPRPATENKSFGYTLTENNGTHKQTICKIIVSNCVDLTHHIQINRFIINIINKGWQGFCFVFVSFSVLFK